MKYPFNPHFGSPGISDDELLLGIVVTHRQTAWPPTVFSLVFGIGTIPVFATSSPSKLSYTVIPKTKG